MRGIGGEVEGEVGVEVSRVGDRFRLRGCGEVSVCCSQASMESSEVEEE